MPHPAAAEPGFGRLPSSLAEPAAREFRAVLTKLRGPPGGSVAGLAQSKSGARKGTTLIRSRTGAERH